MANIKLLSLPSLDNTYQNVIDFSSLSAQSTWFNNKPGYVIEGNIKTDTEQEQLVLDTSLASIRAYDYLYFTDSNGKRLYYFITNKSIKTSETCIVDIECDVWNTYMFDYILMDSYVERCHVPRWNGDIPTMEIVDEGLPFGEQVYSSYENIYNLQNAYIMTSTSPLGKVGDDYYKPGTGGGGTLVGGMLTANGYRFLKGYEGFGTYPYTVPGETARTAGYGIREDYQAQYFELLKPFPCSEMLASSVLGTMLIKNFIEPVRNKMIADGFNPEKYPSNYFDVFVSHAMNAGYGAWSGGDVYAGFKAGKSPAEMAEIIKNWYIRGEDGTVLPGLQARRQSEAKIWTNNEYDKRGIVTINADGSYGPPVTDNNGNGFIPKEFPGKVD